MKKARLELLTHTVYLFITVLCMLICITSCNLLMYDNREVPPRQIPAMKHIYTETVPQTEKPYRFMKAVLSGLPESFEILILMEHDGGYTEFFYLNPGNSILTLKNNLQNPRSIIRNSTGFSVVTGDTETRTLNIVDISGNALEQGLSQFGFGKNETSLTVLPFDPRFPVYDPQAAVPIIVSYTPDNLYTAPYISTSFQGPYTYNGTVKGIRAAFSLLNEANYPATGFWNSNTLSVDQVEALISNTMLIRTSKTSQTLSEKYLFLLDTQTHKLIGPRRDFTDIPAVLFKDADNTVYVLQAIKTDERRTIFQLLDTSLTAKKKLVVYGNAVYPLGIQTKQGKPGLVFLVSSTRWGTPTMFLSVFFLPLAKLGELP